MAIRESRPFSEGTHIRHAWHGRAFILEILVVMLFIIISTTILVQVFAVAKQESEKAASLSYAVMIASDEAELFAARPTDAAERYYRVTDARLEATETPDGDSYRVVRTVTPLRSDAGTLYEADIAVSRQGEPIYEITSARYVSDSEVR